MTSRMEVKDGHLHINDLTAKMYGGTAQAAVAIALDDGTIDIALDITDMNLDQFLTRFASMETPPGLISGR